jgi:hypothetical protein
MPTAPCTAGYAVSSYPKREFNFGARRDFPERADSHSVAV